MNKTHTNSSLIERLTGECKPVERFCKWRNLAKVMLALLLCVGVGLSFIGVRDDLATKLADKPLIFFVENGLMALAGLCAGLAAFRLSVPSIRVCYFSKGLMFVALGIWLGFIILGIINWQTYDFQADINHGKFCMADMLLLGVIPGVLMFLLIRKAAPVKFGLVGMLALLTVFSFTAIASRYMCSMDHMAHLVLWHYVPVLIIACGGVALGRKFLRW